MTQYTLEEMKIAWRSKEAVSWGAALALAVCCTTVWLLVVAATPSGVLTVAVLDVGQGDAIYIESPAGGQLLIDAGPDDSLLRQLPKVIPLLDRSIDAVLETHPHADHVAGFVSLFKRYQVGAFIEPGMSYDTNVVRTVEQEITNENIPRYIARRGMSIDLGGGAVLEILYPDGDVSHVREAKVHDGNVVARLAYGETSVLLMGDATKEVETHLMQLDSVSLSSTVLKVGHHGSRTSTGEAFAALVHPQFAAISVAANNKYHLPNQEPIDSLESDGAEVLRTDEVGTIVFRSDGERLWYVH